MSFHFLQSESEERLERLRRCRAEREVLGLEVPDGAIPRVGPAHEQQRGAEAAQRVRGVIDERGDGIRAAILAPERRRPLVHPLVPAQRPVRQLRRNDSLMMLPSRNVTFAGRSASRRMR